MKHILAVLLASSLFINVNSQCSSTTFVNASIFTTDNSTGVYNFSNPSNAQVSNNSRAVASSLIGLLTGNTYYLVATGFGFNIPSYASICGVTLRVECRATNLLLTAAVRDNDVRIIKNGVITGTNHAASGDWGSTDNLSFYGSGSDLWGTTLTPADVNSANFGIAFSARIIALIAALPTVEIDHISLQIHFNAALPVKLSHFVANKSGDAVAISWKTEEEESGSKIILQRSIDNINWEPLSQYDLNMTTNTKEYKYLDYPPSAGIYYYRLKTILTTGKTDYTDVKKINITTKKTLHTFPNPAVTHITVNTIAPTIKDILGKQLHLPVESIGNESVRLNIQALPKGMYFINANGQTTRFIKQ